jgi:ABC-2 type transport system permease protein
MRGYLAIFSASFRTLLQYRTAALAGIATQVFWGLIRMMILEGFYRSSTAPQPMSYPEVVTYVWLGQALILLVITRIDLDIRAMIRSGTVAYELLRPLDLYQLWFCRSLAQRTAPLLLRMVPIFVIAGLFFGLQAPASLPCAILWLLSTAAAMLLGASIATLMVISMLWTISGEGINRLMGAGIYIFSGSIVPLPLFPDFLQPLLNVLPFRGMADTPFRVYMGHIPPEQALLAIAHQLAWTAAFILLGRWVLSRGVHRLVVQGG